MRVLVAGSHGLIGTPLTAALREAGHDVRRLVRGSGEFSWDPPSGSIDERALDGVDAVINLCGSPMGMRWSAARKQMIVDSRVEPTEVLAEAVAEHGIGTMINASGVHYYGDTGDRITDESAPNGTGFLAGLCQAWESATEVAARSGARVVRLRTGLVLSGHGGLLGPLKPLFFLGLGGRLGSGRQYMPWISLRDEVAAIQFALEHDSISGPVNLCNPEPATNTEFTKALGRMLNRPAPWWAPGLALRAALGETADEMALVSLRVVPAVLQKAEFPFQYTTLDSALAAAL
ncbi:MAG TPA: TIGR01777 family oxidoreductase [Amycolatopsis sp.]|nr:TIGR01777 family oxidoreductase [Amycolatopsis sp.]